MSGTVLAAAAYLLSRKEQWEKLPTPAADGGPLAGADLLERLRSRR